jgi:hypothetical protein
VKKRTKVNRFLWDIQDWRDIDFDILELQLHSLYLKKNIHFRESLYNEELKNSDGYLTIRESRSINLALKSFCKSFCTILKNQRIITKEFDSEKVLDYGEYELELTNSIISDSKARISEALTGKSIMKDMDGQVINQRMLSKTERALSLTTSHLTFFSLFRSDAHVTNGAAINRMLKNLIAFERSIVECALRQLKKDVEEISTNDI